MVSASSGVGTRAPCIPIGIAGIIIPELGPIIEECVIGIVQGLPIFAVADTRAEVEQVIGDTQAAYLETHPGSVPTSAVRVARVSDRQGSKAHAAVTT